MSISPQTLSVIQQLMMQNAELLAQVQRADNAAQAAALIAKMALQQGIDVEEVELAEHLESILKTMSSQTLSDQQLEALAGGEDDPRWVPTSLDTMGSTRKGSCFTRHPPNFPY